MGWALDGEVLLYFNQGNPKPSFLGVWPIYWGPKTCSFHGFGVQRNKLYTYPAHGEPLNFWGLHIFGRKNKGLKLLFHGPLAEIMYMFLGVFSFSGILKLNNDTKKRWHILAKRGPIFVGHSIWLTHWPTCWRKKGPCWWNTSCMMFFRLNARPVAFMTTRFNIPRMSLGAAWWGHHNYYKLIRL